MSETSLNSSMAQTALSESGPSKNDLADNYLGDRELNCRDNSNIRYSMHKATTVDPATVLLNTLVSQGKIREMDRAFALFVNQQLLARPIAESLTQQDSLLLVALAALTSEQLSRQHVCLEISGPDGGQINKAIQPWRPHFTFPEPEYCKRVLCSEAFKALGLMIFDGERLYLQRYWQYEQQVVKRLMHFSAPVFPHANIRECIAQLYTESAQLYTESPQLYTESPQLYTESPQLYTESAQLYTESPQPNTKSAERNPKETEAHQTAEPDWQKNAIALACLNSVSVIAGGPGTGKTTTVVRILWSLCKLYQQLGKSDAIIKMVAPTGKAAARLSESVSGALEKLPSSVTSIPSECSTIHRLLGVVPNSVFFKHHQQRSLNIDVLVVDEASMIDLPLLSKLLSALPSHCRVILLGDSHQLASVEVGSVFSDICRLQQGGNRFSPKLCETLEKITQQPLLGQRQQEGKLNFTASNRQEGDFADNILFLTKSWRFHADSGIGHLAKAVNSGDVGKTLKELRSGRSDLEWHSGVTEQSFLDMVLPHFIKLHKAAFNSETLEDVQLAFSLLSQLQVLTVKRKGKWGLQHLNGLVKQALIKQELIEVNQEFYPGRPIMVSSNDYQNRLFNGDVGLVMLDKQFLQQTGRALYKVYFQDPEQGFRTLLPAQLPEHDTMFAMTTHKSQGSEFAKVIFCLPEGATGGNELLNRELLYTGITRAKSHFVLLADAASVSGAVQRVCQRASGLASVLARYEA